MPDEDDLIRLMAGCIGGAAEIVAAFKREGWTRSRAAIRARAYHVLGLYLSPSAWSARRVCKLFGISNDAVIAAWIQQGLLVAQHQPPGTGCTHGRWVIQQRDLEAFIRECPWAYDASFMTLPNHPLARLARTVQGRDPWVRAEVAAERLGMSVGAVRRWCRVGLIPAKRRSAGIQGGRGGALVIRASDLPWLKAEIEARHLAARQFLTTNLQAVRRERLEAKRAA